jgi:hypothetical protein
MAALIAATWSVLKSHPNRTATLSTNARNAVVALIWFELDSDAAQYHDQPWPSFRRVETGGDVRDVLP